MNPAACFNICECVTMCDRSREFRAAIEDLLPKLQRYSLALTGDRAAASDLAQAACLRALECESQFRPGTRLDSWLVCIAKTIWLNQLRATKVRQGAVSSRPEIIALADAASDAETALFLMQVLSAVADLPEAQRSAVFLVCVEGYSCKDAAARLGVSAGAVRSRVASARARLVSALGRKSDCAAAGKEKGCRTSPRHKALPA